MNHQALTYYAARGVGDYGVAETAARELVRLFDRRNVNNYIFTSTFNQANTALALTLLRQGKLAEAQKILRPILPFYLQKRAVEAEDNEQQVRRANFLLIYALAFPEERRARLTQAHAVFKARPVEIQKWKEFALIGDEIERELAKTP